MSRPVGWTRWFEMAERGVTLWDVNRVLHEPYTLASGKETQLIGETETAMTTFVAFVMSRQFVMVRGFAGTGKSMAANAVWSLLPSGVGMEVQSLTDKALWNMKDEFELAEFVYFTEAQKTLANLDAKELYKSWGEGKTYERRKSVRLTTEDKIDMGTDDDFKTVVTSLSPKPVLTTIAEENEASDTGDEANRRTIILYADPSQQQTRLVVENKLARASNPWADNGVPDDLVDAVKGRVAMIVRGVTMPVAVPGIDKAFVDKLPTEFHDTRSVIDHFLSVVSGVTRFYGPERVTHEGYLLATPSDVFEGFELYKTTLLNNCLRLQNHGEKVLLAFPPLEVVNGKAEAYEEHKKTTSEVMEELKHMGVMLPKNKVQSIIANLMMAGYLEEDSTVKPPLYHRSGVAASPDALVISWGAAADAMMAEAEQILPPEVFSKYKETAKNFINHPLTGEAVNLAAFESSTDPTDGKVERVKTKADKIREQNKGFEDYGITF